MRHLKRTAKLGRKSQHRNMMLSNLVSSLIKHRRITTTLAKAKAAQQVAERMVTLGKRGHTAAAAADSESDARSKARKLADNVHCRRLVAARLHQQPRSLFKSKEERLKWRESEDVVTILFDKIAPTFKDRAGGYTRIVKLATPRRGDAGELAILEFVGSEGPAVSGSTAGDPAGAKAGGDEKAES